MLLAEDLLLLVTDDATGRLSVSREPADAGLGGANLAELTLRGQVDVSGDQGPGQARAHHRPGPFAARGRGSRRRPAGPGQAAGPQAVRRDQAARQEAAARALPAAGGRGVLRAERRRVLGIFPTRSWPAQDPSRKAEVRQQVTRALAGAAAPDERTAALIALLHRAQVRAQGRGPAACQLSRRQLRKRAAEIAQGNWASEAVRKAIDAEIAAGVTVVMGASAGTAVGFSR
jgi:hypothetical protein